MRPNLSLIWSSSALRLLPILRTSRFILQELHLEHAPLLFRPRYLILGSLRRSTPLLMTILSFGKSLTAQSLPLPAPSVESLGGQEEPRAIVDPLLELLRRTCSPWTDPVPERAFTISPDSFDPEEIRREASRASPDQNVLIFYLGVEHPFLAPIRLIDRVFPRSSAKISEIIEIDLD
ncbi:hypothetical protein PUN28_017874 [Cardiocondyla obscurior]|uniref:Uncharacterized protein n=1 Tax=Cardiocondyla obscurior TaxID=286306 RepID=A0AAW2EPP9_9HYME